MIVHSSRPQESAFTSNQGLLGVSAGIADGQVSLGSAVVRLLDPAESSSDSEDGQAVEGNIAARVAAKLAKPQRTPAHWGRLKRAASAPVPPLLGLMSRAGIAFCQLTRTSLPRSGV